MENFLLWLQTNTEKGQQDRKRSMFKDIPTFLICRRGSHFTIHFHLLCLYLVLRKNEGNTLPQSQVQKTYCHTLQGYTLTTLLTTVHIFFPQQGENKIVALIRNTCSFSISVSISNIQIVTAVVQAVIWKSSGVCDAKDRQRLFLRALLPTQGPLQVK